jgi:hypothetical protein
MRQGARRALAGDRARNTVEDYFGPKGLQGPFLGGVRTGALVDIADIADKIKNAIKPPEEDNASSNALTIISYIVKAGPLIRGGKRGRQHPERCIRARRLPDQAERQPGPDRSAGHHQSREPRQRPV